MTSNTYRTVDVGGEGSKEAPRNVTPWYIRMAPKLPLFLAWVLVIFVWVVMAFIATWNMEPYSVFFRYVAAEYLSVEISPMLLRWVISPSAWGSFQVVEMWPAFVPETQASRFRKSLKWAYYAYLSEAAFSLALWWPSTGWASLGFFGALGRVFVILLTVFGARVAVEITKHYLFKGGRD